MTQTPARWMTIESEDDLPRVLATLSTALATNARPVVLVLDSQPRPLLQVRSTPTVRAPIHDLLIEPLTPKETEVLAHLSEMFSTEEIADAMFVSVNTVRTHIRGILRKLAVSRRTEAVRRARALGLIESAT
jgi:DNA-binding CsgD family transcriptional regulator